MMQPNNQLALPQWILALLLVGLVGLSIPGPSYAQDTKSETGEKNFEAMAQRLDRLISTYQTHALNAQVKQQVWLAAAHSFYDEASTIKTDKTTDPPQTKTMLAEASQLGSKEEAEKWLHKHWNSCGLSKQKNNDGEDIGLVDRVTQRIVSKISPGTQYSASEENRVNKQVADNQYVGIGIRVAWEKDRAVIAEPFPGGAAYMAGAVADDYILEADGESMVGLTLAKVIQKLRGPKGSKITVVVQNKDGSEPRTLDMVRDVIPIPSVQGVRQQRDGSWIFVGEQSPELAYLRIDSVVGSTSAELREAARQIHDAKVEGVILDLRNFRNCTVHQMTMICDVLMDKQTIGLLRTADGQSRVISTTEETDFAGLPIAILIDGGHLSGPVLAGLAVLKKRLNTQLIGKPASSDGICFDRFDLADNDGAMVRLPCGQLVPQGQTPSLLQRTNIMGQHVSNPGNRFNLTPDVVVKDAEKLMTEARAFLEKNKSS